MPTQKRKRQTAPTSQQSSLRRFGKISKAQLQPDGPTKKKPRVNETLVEHKIAKTSLKRSLDESEDHATSPASHDTKPPSTPRKKLRVQKGVVETPTKGARTLLQAFNIASTELCEPEPKQLETPPSSQEDADDLPLPRDLADLIDLHSSFLTAFSLHCAHNGFNKPADLRELCPNVGRIWKKRRVAIQDIQTILSLQQAQSSESSTFGLVDYGHGKICLELSASSQRHQRFSVDEESLNAYFRQNLEQAWSTFVQKTGSKSSSKEFFGSLAEFPIKASTSLVKLAPRFEKTQTRLMEFKEGAIRAQERANTTKTATSEGPDAAASRMKNPFDRSASLKSRIFAKQLVRAALPAALTPQQIARRSALHRAADVAGVLESMALSRQRHRNDDADEDPFREVVRSLSFTMPTLVQNVQMSLQNPIAPDEATMCVRLLADLVPEWINVREIGRVVGVIVRGQGIGRVVLSKRVEEALLRDA